ncbi:MAG: isocitrate/isopropylmalate dehydrogenase family protein [Terriglobia bacterium]
MANPYRIVILPGDGIGPEVMSVSLRVLHAVESESLKFDFVEHPIGSGHYQRTGDVLPQSVLQDCLNADAVFLAAMGLPEVRRENGVEVQPEIIVGLRQKLDLYAAVRPVKLYRGAPTCLKQVKQGIDLIVLRENTEGMFASFGGGASVGDQTATDTMVITRAGTERVVEFAFQLAMRRHGRPSDGEKRVTCVDKANVFRSLAFFRKIFFEVAGRHPEISADAVHVDAMSLFLVQNPWDFDVLVMENLFGDILSDLGAGLVGGLGLGPSGEIGASHALFQPSHGSAPQLAGKDIANPLATVLSGAMMLAWLAEKHHDPAAAAAGERIEAAVARVLEEGRVITPDIGGRSGTKAVGDAVVKALAGAR